MSANQQAIENTVGIDVGRDDIFGTLVVPREAWGAIVFAHGSGSSRHSPRNAFVADTLHRMGLATLLIDLLTPAEERVDQFTAQHRFDIGLLTNRLLAATAWMEKNSITHDFPCGYFGASTGAAAALKAAARREDIVAVVSRGGRPDLAGPELENVKAATLLIVGGLDYPVIELNRTALKQLRRASHKELMIVPSATHLFEENGALAMVANLAGEWFVRYLRSAASREDRKRATRGTYDTHSVH